jgi:hypothetical protein
VAVSKMLGEVLVAAGQPVLVMVRPAGLMSAGDHWWSQLQVLLLSDSLLQCSLDVSVAVTDASTAGQSRAEAYCRQPANMVTPGIGPRWDPWPYICSMSRPLCFSLPSLFLLIDKKEGLDFFFITGVSLLHLAPPEVTLK